MNSWGLPTEPVAWTTLCLGLVMVSLALTDRFRERESGAARTERIVRVLLAPSRVGFVASASVLSAVLSWGYFEHYLQGGPRIIDATSYLLEARLIADGTLQITPDGPFPSFHNRFLFATVRDGLASLFPPGYPLLLAVGVALGAPFLVGPLLAAAITAVGYYYVRCAFHDEGMARITAVLMSLCAALRYHTADTMSHGLCVLLFLAAFVAATRAAADVTAGDGAWTRNIWALLSGLSLGWLFATRPLSAVALGAALLVLYGLRARPLALCVLGCVPGVFGYLAQQWSLTGVWGQWAHHAYYATADGPPGCFRLGFGPGIGCLIEHGEFVRRYLPNGYGWVEALGTSARRCVQHLSDVGNVKLVSALVLVALWLGWRQRQAQAIAVAVVVQIVAYALFYFDGNLPGAGARMFADVLALEHVLIAFAVTRLRIAGATFGVMLLGFALFAAPAHQLLGSQQGGRPMFEASTVTSGTRLLFMDTDHGFNLAFAQAPAGRVVARARGDAYDRALWEHLGRPATEVYDFDLDARRQPRAHAFTPAQTWRFEAESAWPALRVTGGWIAPEFRSGPCTSRHRVLELHPQPNQALELEVEIWVPSEGKQRLVVLGEGPFEVSAGSAEWRALDGECSGRTTAPIALPAGPLRLVLRSSAPATLDAFELVEAQGAN